MVVGALLVETMYNSVTGCLSMRGNKVSGWAIKLWDIIFGKVASGDCIMKTQGQEYVQFAMGFVHWRRVPAYQYEIYTACEEKSKSNLSLNDLKAMWYAGNTGAINTLLLIPAPLPPQHYTFHLSPSFIPHRAPHMLVMQGVLTILGSAILLCIVPRTL